MIRPFGRRTRRSADDVDEKHAESVARLVDARELSARAVQVSSSLRETRERNHFAESFQFAMRRA